ncbi:MAG TPA: LysR substrate-binding domain-containing protein [Acidimicrobiales bacterium]|nr:LysR substrate-binding domain-containing protein [Acidimicrobiales bacterium]
MLEVRRLRVLKTVVETGSISAAAAALSYTPSAVSQQVAALERETGSVLIEPAGRGIRPTDAAILLCEHATRVLAAMQEAEDALGALRTGHSGRMRVGAFPTAGSSVVPAALAAFQSQFPRIALDLVVVEPDEGLARLRAGSIDVAVVVEAFGPGQEPDDGLFRTHMLADPFWAVLPKGHRLAGSRAVNLKELANERWIGISSCPGHCEQVVSDNCRKAGFEPHYGLEADEYPTAQGFVAAGLGVALVPLLALGASHHPGVVVRRLLGEQPVRQVWAATRSAIAGQLPVKEMLVDLEKSASEFRATQP